MTNTSIFNAIKRNNSETFAKTLRQHHTGILTIPNITNIVRYAGSEKKNAKDILPYLMSLLDIGELKKEVKTECPFELLKRAGYDAFLVKTEKQKNSISKYFADGEKICTFGDPTRHKRFHVIHIVKHNADKIKRAKKPQRDDEYSTSVSSIQIHKKGGFISIKSRYNSTVPDCDNVLNSNPDNIIDGLSASLMNFFKVDFKAHKIRPPQGYALDGSGLILNYFREYGGNYYGDKAAIIDGKMRTPASHEAWFEIYKFDCRSRILNKIHGGNDTLTEHFNDVYGGKKETRVDSRGNLLFGDVVIFAVSQEGVDKIQEYIRCAS